MLYISIVSNYTFRYIFFLRWVINTFFLYLRIIFSRITTEHKKKKNKTLKISERYPTRTEYFCTEPICWSSFGTKSSGYSVCDKWNEREIYRQLFSNLSADIIWKNTDPWTNNTPYFTGTMKWNLKRTIERPKTVFISIFSTVYRSLNKILFTLYIIRYVANFKTCHFLIAKIFYLRLHSITDD